LPRSDEAPSEILHCSREAEMEREQNLGKMCKVLDEDGKIKRVSPLPELRS
jgi:hypothetical protein